MTKKERNKDDMFHCQYCGGFHKNGLPFIDYTEFEGHLYKYLCFGCMRNICFKKWLNNDKKIKGEK